jgi:A/G-specific adenine glycosylase
MHEIKNYLELDSVKLKAFRRTLRRWGITNRRKFPWRQTTSPYNVLIAEMLLQATTAAKVVPVYEKFIARFPTPALLASASVDEIETMIRSLGLPGRARSMSKIAELLVRDHGGVVPSERMKLLNLPGVGEYTAGAVQSFAFGLPAAIPDTNVIRLLQRFFGLPQTRPSHRGSPGRVLLRVAKDVLPIHETTEFNFAMLDLGSLICTSRNPKCPICPLASHCCTSEAVEFSAAISQQKKRFNHGSVDSGTKTYTQARTGIKNEPPLVQLNK